MANAEPLAIELAYSPKPGKVERWALRLPAGSRVEDAILQSGVLTVHPELVLETLSVGVWGALRALDHPLRDRDRVEVYRPLKVDPKEARRLRYRSHRAKQAR
ncbi:RnfH family protein [Piscinibacter sp. HJYY11]|uniref:RnfH family protein n=1 Tax=Piscinibacter sp. HJYY11 TaxID=2801333 RepID=UPI00191DAD8B|nr:RnfH family protein [Piscinibacter sp. HJYY11]MBL0731193.1 RnfH family protein [Piscinibacter sp. HJYY11]